ncbi:MAG: hypothetical protein RLY71_3983 [Pseudomonadota bacterium]|jgi:SAM-dependent methyltransferase
MKHFWDERYAGPDYKYGTLPNEFLRTQVAGRLSPGNRVLVPGDGEGRNGVWLAGQGMAVTTLDYSAQGVDKALKLAAQHGVALEALCADLAEWRAAPASFDAVALIYLHLPSALRRRAHRQLAEALVPGGWLILEAFEPAQRQFSSGGPRDVDMLMRVEDLREDFAGQLDLELLESVQIELSEGGGHVGPARVVRLIGRRR